MICKRWLHERVSENSFSNCSGTAHQSAVETVVQGKEAGIQALTITITDNDGFIPAGFTGYGNVTHPYVLEGITYGRIEAGGPSGIHISNTDAHFRIQDVVVNGSTDASAGGIKLEHVENGEIINTTVTYSDKGFYLYDTNNTFLKENNATKNLDDGFYLTGYCSFNNLTGNIAVDNAGNGFFIRYLSNNNTLVDNTAIGNAIGFSLFQLNYTTLTSNTATGNIYGFDLWSSCTFNNLTGNNATANLQRGFVLLSSSNNNTLTGNEANGNDDGFYCDNTDYNILIENEVNGNTQSGIYLLDCNNCTVTGTTATANRFGILLEDAVDNNITGNNALGNEDYGIYLASSSSNNITDNVADDNDSGFRFESSCYFNNVTGNNASGNRFGFLIESSQNNSFSKNDATGNQNGFYVWMASNNTYTRNTVKQNDYGFNFDGYCHNNNLTYNTVSENVFNGILLWNSNNNTLTWNTIYRTLTYGVKLETSGDNLIYYNYFIENYYTPVSQDQAYDDSLTHSNRWDNGTHGNYWSDYAGNDAGNGIGDINHTIGGQPVNDTKPLVFVLSLSGPGDQSFEAGSTGNYLTWFPESNFPLAAPETNEYTFYIDSSFSTSGSWTSGGTIQADVPVFVLGEHNYTLVISDFSGKTAVNTVMVMIEDTIAPVIDYTGSSTLTFETGSTGNTFSFTATDLYPGTYTLYQNGTEVGNKYLDLWCFYHS